MRIIDLQHLLNESKVYSGELDGISGKKTIQACRRLLGKAKINTDGWSSNRLLVGAEQLYLKRMGYPETNPGTIDGIVGPRTLSARSKRAMLLASFGEDKDHDPDRDNPLKWLVIAESYIGVHEIKGPKHHPAIMKLLEAGDGTIGDGKTLKGINNDEVPWCASFVSGVLEEAGVMSARTAWARGYLTWGARLDGPAVGCVVVFKRGPSTGHVGFVVGKDKRGRLVVLGGNQSDAVNTKPFALNRVLGYRWPAGADMPKKVGMKSLPLVEAGGKVSTNEA